MVLVLRVVVYELALAAVLVLLPLWVALDWGARFGILAESLQPPGLMLLLLDWALLEEPALERRFGDAYRVYRAQVPAWWPLGTALPLDVRVFFG